MKRLKLVLFLLALVTAQILLARRLALQGVAPQLTAVFVVFWALWTTPRDAFRFGWALGMLWDVAGPGPLGFHGFVYACLGAGAAMAGRWLNRDSHAVRFGLCFAVVCVAQTLLLLVYALEGAGWTAQAWMRAAVWPSLYTGAAGAVLCYAAAHLPFFRTFQPPPRLAAHA